MKDQAAILCPEIDWRSVRGMGNALRHGYSSVSDDEIWSTVQNDLTPLRHAAQRALVFLDRQSKESE